MAKVPGCAITGCIPTFKVGKKHRFHICGKGFVDTPNKLGADFDDPDGGYDWRKNGVKVMHVQDDDIEVQCKPVKNKKHRGKWYGLGNLTITVTNGNGAKVVSPPMKVNYDETRGW